MDFGYANSCLEASLYMSTTDKFIENKSIFLADDETLACVGTIREFLKKEPFFFFNMRNVDGIEFIKETFKSSISDIYIKWLRRNAFYFPGYVSSLEYWWDFFYLFENNFEKHSQFPHSQLFEKFIQKCWVDYNIKSRNNHDLYMEKFIILDTDSNSIEKTKYLYNQLSDYDKFIYDLFYEDDEGYGALYSILEICNDRENLFYLFELVNKILTIDEIKELSNEFQFFITNYLNTHEKVSKEKLATFEEVVKLAL